MKLLEITIFISKHSVEGKPSAALFSSCRASGPCWLLADGDKTAGCSLEAKPLPRKEQNEYSEMTQTSQILWTKLSFMAASIFDDLSDALRGCRQQARHPLPRAHQAVINWGFCQLKLHSNSSWTPAHNEQFQSKVSCQSLAPVDLR